MQSPVLPDSSAVGPNLVLQGRLVGIPGRWLIDEVFKEGRMSYGTGREKSHLGK